MLGLRIEVKHYLRCAVNVFLSRLLGFLHDLRKNVQKYQKFKGTPVFGLYEIEHLHLHKMFLYHEKKIQHDEALCRET
ncbi:hypothetical protein JTB14_016758 [Gonioctena quinquepunctata]|nr:hypothetical protein JTB14_016758 [Gonioctena quinquepunctata]